MFSENVISYWRKGLSIQNFGDLLSELLFRELVKESDFASPAGRITDKFDVIHLIGSVISDFHIQTGLEHVRGYGPQKIAFWCCGKRDRNPLNSELIEHCVFLGARGPLTRDALGLSPDTPLGDPALLLPIIYEACIDHALTEKTICVPHFLEKKSDEQLLFETGVDMIVRPNIPASLEALHRFIDKIVSARFVLCGALHGAIVRCAYEMPFSYFDSGFIDVPFKWEDFSASVGIGARFAKTLSQGEIIYKEDVAGKIRKLDLGRILDCSPFAPPHALRKLASDCRPFPAGFSASSVHRHSTS